MARPRIYGTDAVGGVVNIIMKTNFEGFEVGGRYGWTTNKGHAAERSGYVVGGVSNGKTSMTLSAEWIKQDPIFNYERPYSDPTFGTPTFAGSVNIGTSYYYLDPSKGGAGRRGRRSSGGHAGGERHLFRSARRRRSVSILQSLAIRHANDPERAQEHVTRAGARVVQECESVRRSFSTRRPTPTRRSTASRSLRRSPPARTAIRSTPP